MAFEIARVHGLLAAHVSGSHDDPVPSPLFVHQTGPCSHSSPILPLTGSSPPYASDVYPMGVFGRGQHTRPHSATSLHDPCSTPPHSGLFLDTWHPLEYPSALPFPLLDMWQVPQQTPPFLSLASPNASLESDTLNSGPGGGARAIDWARQACVATSGATAFGSGAGAASKSESEWAVNHQLFSLDRPGAEKVLDPLSLSSTSESVGESGSSAVGSEGGNDRWSSGCSAGVSPTSVLAKPASSAAWDQLFEAAGEVQRVAREEGAPPPPCRNALERVAAVAEVSRCLKRSNSLPSPKGQTPPRWGGGSGGASSSGGGNGGDKDGDAPPCTAPAPRKSFHRSMTSTKDREIAARAAVLATCHAAMRGGHQRRRSDGGPAAPPGAGTPPPPAKYLGRSHSAKSRDGAPGGDGLHAVVLGGSPAPATKEAASGTGVFLPRGAAGEPPEAAGALPGGGKKAQPRSTTVLLPARLVQALGLDVDGNNNVVLGPRVGGGAAAAQGRIQAAPPQQQARASSGGAVGGSGAAKDSRGGHRRTGSTDGCAAPRGPRGARHMRNPSGPQPHTTPAMRGGGRGEELPADWVY